MSLDNTVEPIEPKLSEIAPDVYIPMALWGRDHWSLLGYIESVMEEHAGFQVGFDGRMRQKRRNFRVMAEDYPKPKRTNHAGPRNAMSMDPKYGSRLNNSTCVPWHDDWDVVQDMAEEGFFTLPTEAIQPSVTLHFTERGRKIADQLRRHKAAGGTFATFRPVE